MNSPVDRDCPSLIPADLDVQSILNDLRAWGWRHSKIELACAFGNGYIRKVALSVQPHMGYQHAARLYNLWADEQTRWAARNGGTTLLSD